jgi:hypothetical protein
VKVYNHELDKEFNSLNALKPEELPQKKANGSRNQGRPKSR